MEISDGSKRQRTPESSAPSPKPIPQAAWPRVPDRCLARWHDWGPQLSPQEQKWGPNPEPGSSINFANANEIRKMQNLWLSQAAEAQKLLDTRNTQGKYSPTQDRRNLASEAPGRSQRRRQSLQPASFQAAQLEQNADGGQRPPAPANGGQPMSSAQEELQRLQHLLASDKPPAQSLEQLPADSDSSSSSSSTSESSSTESDDDDYDPDPDPDPTHKRKKKKKKTKSNGKAAAKRAAKKMRKKTLEFILKFQNLNADFDNEVLQKNPMEMAGVMQHAPAIREGLRLLRQEEQAEFEFDEGPACLGHQGQPECHL